MGYDDWYPLGTLNAMSAGRGVNPLRCFLISSTLQMAISTIKVYVSSSLFSFTNEPTRTKQALITAPASTVSYDDFRLPLTHISQPHLYTDPTHTYNIYKILPHLPTCIHTLIIPPLPLVIHISSTHNDVPTPVHTNPSLRGSYQLVMSAKERTRDPWFFAKGTRSKMGG